MSVELSQQTKNLRLYDGDVVELVSDDEEEPVKSVDVAEKRTARKSTAAALEIRTSAVTRRQVALASGNKSTTEPDKFLENFDPESSARERRKLTRKVNLVQPRRIPGALYDEFGFHIATGVDLCDCLQRACPGCYFPCSKCQSTKCGNECRCNRKFVYDQIEYQGCDIIIKNPLTSKP